MRTPRTFLVAMLAVGLGLLTACAGGDEDEFRTAIADGFEQAGLDISDEKIDCVTDSIVETLGGEDRLAELEDQYDSIDELPAEVQSEFSDAAPAAFEECEIDLSGAG